jgi:hypothetical protein
MILHGRNMYALVLAKKVEDMGFWQGKIGEVLKGIYKFWSY